MATTAKTKFGAAPAGGGKVISQLRDETVLLVDPASEGDILGGQAVMVELQPGVGLGIDHGGGQLSAELKLPLSSQFLDGRL